MSLLLFKKYKTINSILICIIIISFLYQSIVYAQGEVIGKSSIKFPLVEPTPLADFNINQAANLRDLQIPKSLGEVQEFHQGNNGKLIIHIQDVHAHYEAQKNYAKIMRSITDLMPEQKVLVALEGASGPLTVEIFKIVPDSKMKLQIADYYLKNGLLNGAEYYSIFADKDINLYGVEDEAIYQENLQVFREAQELKPRVLEYLGLLEKELSIVKHCIFKGEELGLFDLISGYYDGSVSLTEYIKRLVPNTKGDSFPNFELVTKCIQQEEELDLKSGSHM